MCRISAFIYTFLFRSGTQFKTIVEYAPSQRVPKQWSKRDGREGTIYKGTKRLPGVLIALAHTHTHKKKKIQPCVWPSG